MKLVNRQVSAAENCGRKFVGLILGTDQRFRLQLLPPHHAKAKKLASPLTDFYLFLNLKSLPDLTFPKMWKMSSPQFLLSFL